MLRRLSAQRKTVFPRFFFAPSRRGLSVDPFDATSIKIAFNELANLLRTAEIVQKQYDPNGEFIPVTPASNQIVHYSCWPGHVHADEAVVDAKHVDASDQFHNPEIKAFAGSWNCSMDDLPVWEEGRKSLLDVFVLPDGRNWFTFDGEKQDIAAGHNVYFHRTAAHCEGREKRTVELLRSGRNVAYLGPPGIGKNHSMNKAMLWAFKNMGVGGFEKVCVRMGKNLFVNSLKGGKVDVIETDIHDATTLPQLESAMTKICDKKQSDKYLLILELAEDEKDPKGMNCKVLVSASCGNVESETLKTFLKGGGIVLVSDPWSELEAKLAISILRDLFPHHDHIREVWSTFHDRFKYTGGVLRHLMFESDAIALLKAAVIHTVPEVRDRLSGMNIFNIPPACQLYLAPFVEANNVNSAAASPDGNYGFKFKYLSPLMAEYLAQVEYTDCQLEDLTRNGSTWALMETNVIHQLLLSSAADREWRRECHVWDGKTGSRVDNHEFWSKIPSVSRSCDFKGQYLSLPATCLNEKYLYHSRVHDCPVYDQLMVDKANKRVYLFTETAFSPANHLLNLATVHEAMQRLGLFTEELKDFKIVFVLIVPMHKRTVSKLSYLKDCKDNAVIIKETQGGLDAATLKSVHDKIDKTYVLEFEFFPSAIADKAAKMIEYNK